jgi:hypothetical protein
VDARHRPSGAKPYDEATMSDQRERRFTVSDGHRTYVVEATQTHRARPHTMEAVLEWQFYIEAIDLILVQDGKQYVSIDDPNRVFKVVDSGMARRPADSSRNREAS